MKKLLVIGTFLIAGKGVAQDTATLKATIALQQSKIERLEKKLDSIATGPTGAGIIRAVHRAGRGPWVCNDLCAADETCMLAIWNNSMMTCSQEKPTNIILPITCFCAKK